MTKPNLKITKLIKELEFEVEKLKYLYNLYPDLKLSMGQFSSKKVNQDYDTFNVYNKFRNLAIGTSKNIEFEFAGQKQQIEIFSIPKENQVIQRQTRFSKNGKSRSIIAFTKFFQTFKFKKFDEPSIIKVRKKILEFIQDPSNRNSELDDSNLDEKMKKLLNFS